MSKCFGGLMEQIENERAGYEPNEDQWFVKFDSPEKYAESRISILEDDMCIHPSDEECEHVLSLKTRNDIDRAIRVIINRAWS